MRLTLTHTLIILLLLAGAVFGCTRSTPDAPPEPPSATTCQRIVSLAPSITEVLFALGLGTRLVGNTDYCNYPPEATTITRIGGYSTPNPEAILGVRPDLIITLEEHEEARAFAHTSGLFSLTVSHHSFSGLLDSVRQIGALCAVAEADSLYQQLSERIDRVRQRRTGQQAPRVLVVVGRHADETVVRNLFVAGKGSFYNDVIKVAGGRNAYEGDILYPSVSREGVLHMAPDVILELLPGQTLTAARRQALVGGWQELASVPAVAHHKVFLFTEDYASIPGPRALLFLEQVAALLFPGP